MKSTPHMEALRPNQQRAKTAVLFLYIAIAMDICSLISEYMQYSLLKTVAGGGYISEDDVSSNDIREGILAILYLLVFISCGILFISWFRRAYYNLHLKTDYLKYGEGWAAGAWFTPILCLFRPFEIMKELYTETDAILLRKSEGYRPRTNNMVLGSWWTLWIISCLMGNFILKSSMKAQTVDEMLFASMANMVSSLMGIPLGLLAIKLVKDYSNMETILAELKDEPNNPEINPEVEQPLAPTMQIN